MSGFRGGFKVGKGGKSHSYATTQKGLFEDRTWKCDCKPRLPANHFQVKAQTANKGRWFYTCQKDNRDSESCKFFLWEDEAKPREASAVLSNSHTEPIAAPATPPRKPPAVTLTRPTPHAFTPSDYGLPDSDYGNRKHSYSGTEDSYGWDNKMDRGELEQLGKQYETPIKPPETPRKAVKTEAFTTPSTTRRKLPWLLENTAVNGDGLPTPETNSKTESQSGRISPSVASTSSYITAAGSDRQKEILRGYTLPAQYTTPTPTRFRDVNTSDQDGCRLITDVFAVLEANHVSLDEDAKEGVRRVLNKFDLRTQGIIKGREISRLAIKAKDARITELQLRISTLEAELETEKALVQHFKWKIEHDQDTE